MITLINALFTLIAILSSTCAGKTIGQALVGRTDELVILLVIRKALVLKHLLVDQFRFALFDLFAMEGVVFDIIAQLIGFQVGVVFFAAIARIGDDVPGQASLIILQTVAPGSWCLQLSGAG